MPIGPKRGDLIIERRANAPAYANHHDLAVHGGNTPAVFSEYIDVYDISQAVEDGATVPIYYEIRQQLQPYPRS